MSHKEIAFYNELKGAMRGEVRTDAINRRVYSVDASIFELEPMAIAIPVDEDDLAVALRAAADHEVPVTARGAATGITGGCLGNGLVIDLSRYFNKIIEVNIEKEFVICQPGVVQDRLNEVLASHGYRLGPDTSTGNRATVGGMLANNSAGARSLLYGSMRDHILEATMLLEGATRILCGALTEEEYSSKLALEGREGHIYREVDKIIKGYAKEIDSNTPEIPRHVSGYNLKGLLHDPHHNLCQLIAGSEGTLGIVTQMKLHIVKKLRYTSLCLILVDDMIAALKTIPHLLTFHPISLEMIDSHILEAAKGSRTLPKGIGWLGSNAQAIFIAEFEGGSSEEAAEKAQKFSQAIRDIGSQQIVVTEKAAMATVWEVRKAGLGLLLSKRSYSRAIAFIEDISIGPENLAPFLAEFTQYLKTQGKSAGIYGHIGSGCMHIRPYIDLRDPKEMALMRKMMGDVAELVKKYKGAMSGEHGDGLIRSWLNESLFGKRLYEAFCGVKEAFDPSNLMNPGKIVHGKPPTQHLRTDPGVPMRSVKTFLDFSAEGGIELAADLCNGNGQCRKTEGVMCPSFQASGDEYDTTRARAQSLRALFHGKLPKDAWGGKEIHDVLDLCIECKGCKRECPSQVDMAKMKSEFLYTYQKKHGFSLRSRLFANVAKMNRLGSLWPSAYNFFAKAGTGTWIKKLLGITPERPLPNLAPQKFTSWFKTWEQQAQQDNSVTLFVDTYTEYHEPNIGIAACKVFAALGLHVEIISNACCGRPMISKGFLEEAKNAAQMLVERLLPQSTPIVVLEPSCASAIRDDFRGLLGNDNEALKKVSERCFTFEEFLATHIVNGILPIQLEKIEERILLHTHCHQKALVGSIPTLQVLRALPGTTVDEIPSGCCGLAGSFGYEAEHYDFSMKIGELKLFPDIRCTPETTPITASGTSCRAQILQGTSRKASHLAEILAQRLLPSL